MNLRDQTKLAVDTGSLVAGLFGALAGGSLAPLVCAVGPPLLIRWLWSERVPPIFLVCLLLQWLYTSINIYFASWTGYIPAMPRGVPNATLTMTVIMTGLLCQAAGFALAFRALQRHGKSLRNLDFPYDLTRLRWLCIASAVVATLVDPPAHASGLATLVSALLWFRIVLLALLVYGTLTQDSSRSSLLKTLSVVVIATALCFGSRQSTFKEVVLVCLAAAACAYHIRPTERSQRINNRRIAVGTVAMMMCLFYCGILWESQIKPVWRFQTLPRGKFERIGDFMRLVATKAPETDSREGIDALMKRMNNMWQMSLALERVPRVVAHTHGQLTWTAIRHVLMPRFLFPGKPSLAITDRTYAERFLGIHVSRKASVGIGYVTEFYVDYGIPGMFLACLGLGVVLGTVALHLIAYAPTKSLGLAIALVALWCCFSNYEANLAKALGALLSHGVLFLILGHAVDSMLRTRGRRRVSRTLRGPSMGEIPNLCPASAVARIRILQNHGPYGERV